MIAAAAYNTTPGIKQPVKLEDLMPRLKERQRTARSRGQTAEEMTAACMALAAFTGSGKRGG